MEEPPPNKICFLAILFIAICFCVSCTEDKVAIVYAKPNIVLDFAETGIPLQRLSVFVQITSNVRRLDYIVVKSGEYTWTIEEPFIFEYEEKSWAGYMHLEPPSNLGKFPKGKYSFEVVDAIGGKAEGSFSVSYDDELIDKEFSAKIFSARKWKERVAVYSEQSELLYFDAPKEDWKNDKQVFSFVKDSDFLRCVFEIGMQICFAPKIYKDGGSKNEL